MLVKERKLLDSRRCKTEPTEPFFLMLAACITPGNSLVFRGDDGKILFFIMITNEIAGS